MKYKMHRKIVTKKCDWGMDRKGVSYRKGGMLALSEFNYDNGEEGYRITAIGLDMMDNFRRNFYPTNIDLLNMSKTEAMDIYNELLIGPSKKLNTMIRNGELEMEGWSPNVYGGHYEEGKIAQTITSPFLYKSVVGGGGLMTLDSALIRDHSKKHKMSEDCMIKNIVAHEMDHLEVNRLNYSGIAEISPREKEIRAIKKGTEAVLLGGYSISKNFLISNLTEGDGYRDPPNRNEAIDIVNSWIEDWSSQYSDLIIDGNDIWIQSFREEKEKRDSEQKEYEERQQSRDKDWYEMSDVSDDELREDAIRNGTYDSSDDEEDGTELIDNEVKNFFRR